MHYYKTKIEEELIMNVGVAESVSSSTGNLSSMYGNRGDVHSRTVLPDTPLLV